MRRTPSLIVAALLVAHPCAALAGQFYAIGSGSGIEIAENIADLVSDKFTEHYPAARYAIHVIYDFQSHAEGGGVGFAVAGVVPRAKGSDWTYTPLDRFVVTQRYNGARLDAQERQRLGLETIRQAVRHMMQACDSSPHCDILR